MFNASKSNPPPTAEPSAMCKPMRELRLRRETSRGGEFGATVGKRACWVCAVVLIAVLPVAAAEIHVHFSALQRILADQAFTQDGRLYVKGGPKDRCRFAFLEKPVVGADRGRIAIRARFSGRSAQNLFGACIGLGDSFDILISAKPQYRSGALALTEVRVDSPGRDGIYIRLVRASMADSLSHQFKYPLAAEAKRMLEAGPPPLRRELGQFSVSDIRVEPDSLVVVLEFQLAVR